MKLSQTGFPAGINSANTTAAGFMQLSSTSDPSSLFEEMRDFVVIEVVEEPLTHTELSEEKPGVSHKNFFGENLNRIIKTLTK